MLAQPVGRQFLRAFGGEDVGDELHVARLVLPRQRDGVGHARVPLELALHVAQLDAEAAHLDEVVLPANELVVAVAQSARQVARLVDGVVGVVAEGVRRTKISRVSSGFL